MDSQTDGQINRRKKELKKDKCIINSAETSVLFVPVPMNEGGNIRKSI